ncbi:MAG TPA: cytochrome c [Alphaproteobacteria bacterium]|nr:cytochrome c [Alphaproteobacteria bacterium]
MDSNASVMGSIGELQGEEAIAAAQTLVDNFTRLPTLFPEDSQAGATRALPLIWEDWTGFEAQVAMAKGAAEALLAAAQSGDAAAIGEAARNMGAQCGACHGKYRAP